MTGCTLEESKAGKTDILADTTKYLGVTISQKNPHATPWTESLVKATRRANEIKHGGYSSTIRQKMINTYIIPIFSYLFRFLLAPDGLYDRITAIIRTNIIR